MNIRAVGPNNEPQASIALFIPGGGQSALNWTSKFDYAEHKMARVGFNAIGIGGGAGVLPGMFGTAINPKVEVLFRNVELRRFNFQFLFAPVSQKESFQVNNIIKTLRYYSSPTTTNLAGDEVPTDPNSTYLDTVDNLLTGGNVNWKDTFGNIGNTVLNGQFNTAWDTFTGALQNIAPNQVNYLTTGNLFKAPSEFLIDFYQGSNINPSIIRIGRSVIDDIQVDYTPDGEFSTFSNGYPVSTRLSVSFREMKVISRYDVQRGF